MVKVITRVKVSRFAFDNDELGIRNPKLPEKVLSPSSIYAEEKRLIANLRKQKEIPLEKANEIMRNVCDWYLDLNTVFSHHIRTIANDINIASFWLYHWLIRLILTHYPYNEGSVVDMITRYKLTEPINEDKEIEIAMAYRKLVENKQRKALEALDVAEKCIDYSRIKIGNDYVMSRLNRLVIEEERRELLKEFNKIKDFTIYQFIEHDAWRAVSPVTLALVGALVMDPIRTELFRDHMRRKASELLGIPIK